MVGQAPGRSGGLVHLVESSSLGCRFKAHRGTLGAWPHLPRLSFQICKMGLVGVLLLGWYTFLRQPVAPGACSHRRCCSVVALLGHFQIIFESHLIYSGLQWKESLVCNLVPLVH